MRRFLILALIFLSFVLLFTKTCQAARSVTISSGKDSLFGDEEMVVNATLSGFTDGETIYIKGAFYEDGTTNYFGYTKNGDDWVKNGSSTTSQRQIKIGEWDGQLSVKSDFSDSGFKGESTYKFKLGFYYTTSGGNLSGVNWSTNILDINLNEPDPTPIPTPSPAATSTSLQTTTKSQSPKPSPPTAIKSPTPSNLPSPEVLGAKSQTSNIDLASATPSTQPAPTQLKSSSSAKIAAILVGSGLIMLTVSVSLFLWYRKLHPLQVQSAQQNYEVDD